MARFHRNSNDIGPGRLLVLLVPLGACRAGSSPSDDSRPCLNSGKDKLQSSVGPLGTCFPYLPPTVLEKGCRQCGAKVSHYSRCPIFNHNRIRQSERSRELTQLHKNIEDYLKRLNDSATGAAVSEHEQSPEEVVQHPRELSQEDVHEGWVDCEIVRQISEAVVTEETRNKCLAELAEGEKRGWKLRD